MPRERQAGNVKREHASPADSATLDLMSFPLYRAR